MLPAPQGTELVALRWMLALVKSAMGMLLHREKDERKLSHTIILENDTFW